MSCILQTFSSYQSQMYIENRLRSDSSSSTEQLYCDMMPQQTKMTSQKQIPNIILTNFQPSKSSLLCNSRINITPVNKQAQDEQMDNLNLFLNILSQIHSQQSSDQLKKDESAIIERKRELRRLKIQKYREKKQSRKWDVLRYEVRKNIAKSRLRIKGRFVRE